MTGEFYYSQNLRFDYSIEIARTENGEKMYIAGRNGDFTDTVMPPSSLCDINSRKYLFAEKDNCLDIAFSKAYYESPLYICAAYDDYSCILDENMNELCRIEY